MPPITADVHEVTCAMPTRAEVMLPALSAQVRVARRWAVMTLADWCMAHACENASLVLDELAANAVRHAGGHTFRVWLLTDCRTGLVIMVEDSSRLMPVRPDPDPLAESGRGLRIVEAFADQWDAYATATGKAVWALLSLDP